MKELRFSVGAPDAARSSSWKLWAWKRDVYLVQRGLHVQKFSFHESRVCRWASVEERPDGSDRAILNWKRDLIPSKGSGLACLLVGIVFPTNHLSLSRIRDGKEITYIAPAPPGWATKVEVFLSADDKEEVSRCLTTGIRELVFYGEVKPSFNVCVTKYDFECGPVDLRVPDAPDLPGKMFGETMFPNKDTMHTGRPIRLLITGKKVPPEVWELGGHRVDNFPTAIFNKAKSEEPRTRSGKGT